MENMIMPCACPSQNISADNHTWYVAKMLCAEEWSGGVMDNEMRIMMRHHYDHHVKIGAPKWVEQFTHIHEQ